MTDLDVRSLYLNLIRRYLTRYGMRERMPAQWSPRRRLLLKTLNTLNPMFVDASPFGERLLLKTLNTFHPMFMGASRFGEYKRDLGRDWPAELESQSRFAGW